MKSWLGGWLLSPRAGELTRFNGNTCWQVAADLFANICTRTWALNTMRETRSFVAILGTQATDDEAARVSQKDKALLAKAEARAIRFLLLCWLWVE